jgi:hypothetical protein
LAALAVGEPGGKLKQKGEKKKEEKKHPDTPHEIVSCPRR